MREVVLLALGGRHGRRGLPKHDKVFLVFDVNVAEFVRVGHVNPVFLFLKYIDL